MSPETESIGIERYFTLWLTKLEKFMEEKDKRYEQRFDAQEKTVLSALAAADRAVLKAELAVEKRLEGVNEFRSTLADQQRLLMPRKEVELMEKTLGASSDATQKQVAALQEERKGIKGGWGYAVGVIGFVFMLFSIIITFLKVIK